MELISIKLGNEKFKSGEVWYKLHSDYWRKGYGTESLHEILNFGFEKLELVNSHNIKLLNIEFVLGLCVVFNTSNNRIVIENLKL